MKDRLRSRAKYHLACTNLVYDFLLNYFVFVFPREQFRVERVGQSKAVLEDDSPEGFPQIARNTIFLHEFPCLFFEFIELGDLQFRDIFLNILKPDLTVL